MHWPLLSIVVCTYNRGPLLLATLQHLEQHLYYEGEQRLIIADDGSDDGTVDAVLARFPRAHIVVSDRVGLGANTNAGLRVAFAFGEYILQLQDDMHLLTTLDLHPHVERLREDETCGFIRLWGVGGHRYEGRLEGNYWRIYWHSDELYIPSDRPHIKHRRFHDFYGMYPEGLKTAHTEDHWCHQCKNRAGLDGRQLDVFVPQNADTERSWEHMGWNGRWREQGL